MRKQLVSLAVVAIALLVGVGLAEGATRLCAAISRPLGDGLRGWDPMAVQIEPFGHMGYRQRPNSVLHYFNGTTASTNALAYRGPEVSIARPAGTIRILLFGGSTTHGYGVNDDQTIDAYMRTLLPAAYPGRHFEVVNLALDGYDTYQILQRLQSDGLRLQPNIVILNVGINDVRSAWYPNLRDADPRTLIWADVLDRLVAEQARGGPTLWSRVKHYSYLARVPGYINEQLRRRREINARKVRTAADSAAGARPTAAAKGTSGTSGPPYPDAANFFERHVRQSVALSLQNGAAVLLSTPPSALRSYAPTATSEQNYWVWDAKTTQDYRDELARRLRLIEADEHREGQPVRYVTPSVPLPFFLDDCHLKPDGNRSVAASFVEAIAPLIPPVGSVR